MVAVKNILVPNDFSDCSRIALQAAMDLSHRTGAALHTLFAEVLHGESFAPEAAGPAEGDAARNRLRDHVAEEVRSRPDWQSEALPVSHSVVRDIAPASAIISYADEHDIDLIVMGTHGRRGLRRLLLGSVAEEVVRLAPCSVFTIRCKTALPASGLHVQRILVPIDFSKHSVEALRTAAGLADLYGARLDLLHVVEDRLHPAFYNAGVFSIYDVQPDIEEKAIESLERLLSDTVGPEAQASFHAAPGQAAHGIVTFAETHHADMIVMSTHGLTGLEHFFIGSVAEKVVRVASCPVFTLKAFHPSTIGSRQTA